jgi:subtilisin family serine protease
MREMKNEARRVLAVAILLAISALAHADEPGGDASMPADDPPVPEGLPLSPFDDGTEPTGDQLSPPAWDDPMMPEDPDRPISDSETPIDQFPPPEDPGVMPEPYVAVDEPELEDLAVDRIPHELLQAVAAGAHVPVIVELDVPPPPPDELPFLPEERVEVREMQARLLQDLAAAGVQVRDFNGFAIVPGAAMTVDARALNALAGLSYVVQVERDIVVFPTLDVSTVTVGVPDALGAGLSGGGQTVAVLDTGVQSSHPFLGGRVVSEACYSLNLCPGNTSGPQTGAGTAQPCTVNNDCQHGTHVAGIAAGLNSSMSGVARGATVISVQVFSRENNASICSPRPAPCVLAYTSHLVDGLTRVYNLRTTYNIAAANMSLGGGGPFTGYCNSTVPSLTSIIGLLRGVNIATVISSGNESFNNGVGFPGCIQDAITVGSVDDNDVVASTSNSGPQVDLMAPGVGIVSSIPSSTFGTKSGTSMAAPHITGAFAVMKQRYPAGTVNFIEQELKNTGISVTDTAAAMTRPRLWLPFGWRWQSGSGSGWIGWWNIDQNADRFLVGDFDGDGRDDLLSIKNPWVHLHRYTGSGWQFMWGTNSGAIHWWLLSSSDKYVVADFDGDGRDELLAIKDPWAHLMKFTGSGWQFLWGTGGGWIGWWNMDLSDKYLAGDFNGDGRAELLSVKDPWHHVHQFNGGGWSWLGGSNSGWIGWWNIDGADQYAAGDVDGDGRDDFLSFKPPWHHVHRFNSGAWQWMTGTGTNVIALWNMSWLDRHVPLDMDGDGSAELMHFKAPWTHNNNYSGGWQWFWGTGSGRYALWNMSLSDRYLAGDFDGNGREDILSIKDPWHHVSIWKN